MQNNLWNYFSPQQQRKQKLYQLSKWKKNRPADQFWRHIYNSFFRIWGQVINNSLKCVCSEYPEWQSFYDQRHGNFCKSGYVIRCIYALSSFLLYLYYSYACHYHSNILSSCSPVMYIARHLDDMSEFPRMSIFWQDLLGKSLWNIFDRPYAAKFY